MGKLDGKITIVTGATSGIGRRTVEIFVEEGAKVVATGRREELGRTLEAALGKDKCLFVKADATQEADVKAMFDACLAEVGPARLPVQQCRRPGAGGRHRDGAGRGLRRGDGDAGALGHAGHEARRADHDEAGLGQHHQQRQRRRPSRRLLDLDDLWRRQGRGEPPHGLRRHAARREERAGATRSRRAASPPASSPRRWACRPTRPTATPRR